MRHHTRGLLQMEQAKQTYRDILNQSLQSAIDELLLDYRDMEVIRYENTTLGLEWYIVGTIRVLCMFCGVHIETKAGQGCEGVSHGICPDCRENV